jgi:hypothetical protein
MHSTSDHNENLQVAASCITHQLERTAILILSTYQGAQFRSMRRMQAGDTRGTRIATLLTTVETVS